MISNARIVKYKGDSRIFDLNIQYQRVVFVIDKLELKVGN